MAVTKDFLILSKGSDYISARYDTIDDAISEASDFAATGDSEYVVYEAVRAVKPERAPVSVTTL